MKVLLFMAMSLDAVIASNNGDEDFLSHANWETFQSFAKEYGCFIVGRKTYEAVSDWSDCGFDDFAKETKIVISRNADYSLRSDYHLAKDPQNAIHLAESLGHDRTIVTGGGMINNAFLSAQIVNEIVINIEPVFMGQGVRVFGDAPVSACLEFQGSREIGEGIVQLKYLVK